MSPRLDPPLQRNIDQVLNSIDPARAVEFRRQMEKMESAIDHAEKTGAPHAMGIYTMRAGASPSRASGDDDGEHSRISKEPLKTPRTSADADSDTADRLKALEDRVQALEDKDTGADNRTSARALAPVAMPSGLTLAQRLGAEDRLTATESAVAKHTGVTLAEAHQARDLLASRAPARVTGPRVTAEDRATGKLLNLSEDEIQAAAELRFKRYGT